VVVSAGENDRVVDVALGGRQSARSIGSGPAEGPLYEALRSAVCSPSSTECRNDNSGEFGAIAGLTRLSAVDLLPVVSVIFRHLAFLYAADRRVAIASQGTQFACGSRPMAVSDGGERPLAR
jgi:hypothetical protein